MQSTESISAKRVRASPSLRERLDGFGLSVPFLACVAILALVPVFVKDPYILRLLVISLYFGILAMAFDFTGGFINAVNFGFAGFVGLGAYAAALIAVDTRFSSWLGLLVAVLASGLVGFFTGILTLRLRGIYVSLMSWFVGLTLMALATAMVKVTHGARGLVVPPLYASATTVSYFYIFLVTLVVMYVGLRWVIQSRAGLAFRAIGQNYDAARASGINPTQYKLLNFTISCACAGLMGGFYAHFVGIVTPDIMDTGHTMEVMALSFIGGSGSLLGGVFASFLLLPILDSLKKLMEYRLIIYGLLLILVMIFYPAGLYGLYQKTIQYFKNRKGSKPS